MAIGTTAALIGGAALFGGSAYMNKRASDKAANAAKDAANVQADWQQEALDYMKERDAIPVELRDKALTKLQGIYGQGKSSIDQDALIKKAISSPLYKGIMSGREFGEDAILRNASATGGLRSGNVQGAMYDYNTQLQHKALLDAYNQQMTIQQEGIAGLQGLAGLPSNAPAVATQMNSVGTTYAQGQIAEAQAKQAGIQNMLSTGMGMANLGIQAYGAGMFSDRRLKKNIKYVGRHKGWNWYSWNWNIVAQKMGLTGNTIGCMADEVYKERPDAVFLKNLFMMIDYSKIGILKPYLEGV